MSNLCAICEAGTIFFTRRKIANNEVVCEDCFKKAKSLTTKQVMRLKTVTADEIKDSILKSGGKIEKGNYLPPVKDTIIKCTKCRSMDIQFMQNNKKAFSVGKAAGGAVLTGGIGVIAGFAGKKGEDQWRCNNCGEIFATKRQK